jgi:Tol biopolymer transport system component
MVSQIDLCKIVPMFNWFNWFNRVRAHFAVVAFALACGCGSSDSSPTGSSKDGAAISEVATTAPDAEVADTSVGSGHDAAGPVASVDSGIDAAGSAVSIDLGADVAGPVAAVDAGPEAKDRGMGVDAGADANERGTVVDGRADTDGAKTEGGRSSGDAASDGIAVGGPDAAGVADTGGSASWSPLPLTTLVFAKTVRSGANHLYAYDIATNAATRISVLDDDGLTGTIVNGIALSPDRKWIAFAATFRPSATDVGASAATSDAIWLVSVDGSTYRRLTPTFPNAYTTPCSADIACTAMGMTCNLTYQQCRYKNFTMTVENPSWAPSGDTVWFDYQEGWNLLDGTYAGGGSLANVSSTGGSPNIVASADPCLFTLGPSLDPTGTKIAAIRVLCTNEADGLVLFDIASKQTTLLVGTSLTAAVSDIEVGAGQGPVFSHDGSAIAFVGLRGNSGSTPYEDLYFYSADTGQTTDLYKGTSDSKTWVKSLAFSPDNDHFVLSVAGDLYLYQASKLTGTPTQLTTDGKNSMPSW